MRAVPMTVSPRLIFLGVFLTAVVILLLLVILAPANAANAPSNFSATAGDTQVTLTWDDPNDDDITGYQVLQVAIDKLVVPSTVTSAIEAGDRFGDSVGIAGNTAVVGAPLQESLDNQSVSITNGGWGHTFSRGSGGWSYDEFLAVSNPQVEGRLGSSVAVAGSTVMAGAPSYHQNNNTDPGEVTIASKSSLTGSLATEFTKTGQFGNDLFGRSVALDTGIAVVGAPGALIGSDALAGKAYLYTKDNSGVWGPAATAIWSAGTNAGAGTVFGSSVAVDGNTVVIGSPGEDFYSGAAYVFTKDSMGAWSAVRLTASDRANADSFGRWVAVDGDFVVVGAWQDDDGGTNSGSVYVFTKPNGGWGTWVTLSTSSKAALTAKLTASDAAAEDHFGWSVAVDGDNVVVGAYGNDDDGTDSGSVYLFTKPSGVWVDATETVKLTAPDGAADDNFGDSVAAGGGRAIVGAPGDELLTGAAYVFSIPEWTAITGSGPGTTSHTVTGLDNDVEYTFLIRPVDSSGPGPASGSKQATPVQSPAATPANLTAVAVVDQVTLSWDDPNDSTITGYKYRQKEAAGSFGQWTLIPDSGYGEANTIGYTVRGLTDGQTYTFRIRAVDEDGDTANSGDVTVTTILAAPTTLSATVGAGQIELNWDNPNNTLIAKYQYSTNGGTSFTDITGSSATTTAYTVTGLDNGDEYTLAVRAVNDSVNGQAATVTATPLLPAPTNLVATPYSQRVVLEWDTGGVGYEQYQITIETSGTGVVPTPYIVSASSEPRTSVEITPLTDNTAYTFAVLSVYVPPGLSGTPKITGMAAVVTATPIPVPAAPANFTATPLDMQVQLTWDDPANTTITKYELLQLAEESELIASDAAKNDRFGVSVAVDNDTAVVGAFQPTYTDPDTSLDVSRPGAAYVYIKDSNGAWSQQAKLTASDGADGDEFGISVAVDGDTVVVGARGNVSKTGAIYVFTKPSDGDWTSTITETKLTAAGGAADDLFGASVALYGESTIVVGAPGDQITVGGVVVRSGSAYVFTKNSGVWSQAANLTATDAQTGDEFGISVAVDDDTIAVGAYGKDGNSIADSGLVYVFVKPEADGGWANASTETVRLRASDRAANDNFGRSVAVGSSTIVVGASGDQNTVGGAEVSTGSAYVFTRPDNGWTNSAGTETAKLTASDGAHIDQFGRSVAVYSDTILVGAHQNDDDGSDSGSIYVFIKPTNGWTDITGTVKLTASNGKAGDRFGIALALDGATALVAAPRNDANDDDADTGNDVLDAGSAYVIGTSGWAKIPDDDAGNRYHEVTSLTNFYTYTFALRAVNASGDGPASTVTGVPMPVPAAPVILSATPGDGQVALTWDDPEDDTITKYQYSTDYIINGGGNGNNGGATFSDIPGSQADTTAYTVTGLANGTTHTLALRAVNDFGDGMPSAVTALMIPAAPMLSAAAGDTEVALSWPDPGNATITKYQLLQEELTKLSGFGGEYDDPEANDNIGAGVAIDGDTAVVGASGDTDARGAAYVFTRVSGAWTKQATLTASDGEASDFFGTSVALSGDTVVIGATGDGDNGSGSGSVYVFTKPDGDWVDATQTAKLTASDGEMDDNFGRSVAVDGDTVVVGATGDDSDRGSAYVFTKPDGDWVNATQTAKLTASDGAEGDNFGRSVAVDGDTVVIGSPGANSARGGAYVFTKPDGGWVDVNETARLTASDRGNGDELGLSVAIDADTVVAGAIGDDDKGTKSGSAYVFTKPDTDDGWADDDYNGKETAKLTAYDGAEDDWFGRTVAVDSNVALIGAPTDYTRRTDFGSAYLFTRTSGTWIETAKLNAPDAVAGDGFGYSVALDGNAAVVGAIYAFSDGAKFAGGAYVFTKLDSDWADISGSDATTTSHNVAGLTNYQEYWFRIRAINQTGVGPASNGASAIPRLPNPAKPANLTAEAGDQEVMLSWTNPNDAGIDKYQISEVIEEDFLTASDGATGDHFGVSVAVDGDTAVVGADRAKRNRKGAAYTSSPGIPTAPGPSRPSWTANLRATSSVGPLRWRETP